MESQPVSRDSLKDAPSDPLKGKVVGPAPDGEGLLVEVAGQRFPARGDPSTEPGTPVVLQPDREGGWKAAPLGKALPPQLRTQLELLLSQLLGSPGPEGMPPLPPRIRLILAEIREGLGAKGQAILPQAQALAGILRQLPAPPAGASPLSLEARQRPLLLKVDDPAAVPSHGQQFLEITGPGTRSTSSPATASYSARLGGRPVGLEGPPGLAGNLGLWDVWPGPDGGWLTPASAHVPQDSSPPLPRTVERSVAGITGLLQRLVPESLNAAEPQLAQHTGELASLIAQVVEETPGMPDSHARELDTRTLLRLLDAWSRQEGPSPESLLPPKERLRSLFEGIVSRHAPLEERTAALATLAGAHGNALPALDAWFRQNVSDPPRPFFPLGEAGEERFDDLPSALARDLASLPPDSPLRAELREAARDLLGSDLRAGHSPEGQVQLPWVQPQPQGWQEGSLKVLDRRRARGPETPPDRTRVAISMNPPDLGQVDASLELSGTRLGVELHALDPGTARLVRRELPQLERALKALGLEPVLNAPEEASKLSARRTVPQARSGLDLQA